MSWFGMVVALAVAAALLHNEPWVQRLFGLVGSTGPSVHSPGPDGALAALGTGAPATRSIDRHVHRASWGAKLLVVIAFALLGLVFWNMRGSSGPIQPAASDMLPNILMAALGAWFGLWTLLFRIEHDRDTLTIRGLDFRMRDYPLRDLIAFREGDNKVWNLHFVDGRKVRVMKMVVDADALRQRLEDVLKDNMRG